MRRLTGFRDTTISKSDDCMNKATRYEMHAFAEGIIAGDARSFEGASMVIRVDLIN